jgi:hypothetical protein
MMEYWDRKVLPGLDEWERWFTKQFAGAVSMGRILYDFDQLLFRIALVDRNGKEVTVDIPRFTLEEALHILRQWRLVEQFFKEVARQRLAWG